jgi:hypothetical protein
MKTTGQIAGLIRCMLGYDSTGSYDAIVHTIADHADELRERVQFVVDCMLEDGGLRRNERGWLFVPRPAVD